ncbi:MAG: metal-dependent transcriptional regulator [Deltaproteobacteria bacterium]|nr:metal-dependent transcriptional regulator [Deltaproteobacteria bacterium]
MTPDLEVWKEFEANELTHSMAHYLIAVRDLIMEQGYARITDVAKKLNIARSSASIGLRTLIDKNFVKEDPNKFVRLTEKGEQIAGEIVGKKVVLRRFLEEILLVKPHQAEVDTCKIEHLISSETGARLLDFLRFMTSNDPCAEQVLRAFWAGRPTCEGPEDCPICKDACLRETMPVPIKKRYNR